ncbi:type IV pilus assembly protein PilN [Desulfocicer vacuolatum DSM 3385]|uniref:Type IV pilus assembly protein PilN n=1 Tax=Desulfocicer vacuolatum DSM 3385 TaxID=1121400 RepID=A0A1W1ZVC2_9BACT|nr:PilN domain-containing protein [Desulfocicer vacuolatum]SMC52008.1 type IV pilus assembly protein PilN [Desulfocicer vacuolatum DSM 3385]
MIRINLLPFRAARKKENIRRQVSIFCLMVILVVLSLIYYTTWVDRKIDLLNNNIAQIKKEITLYKDKADEVTKIKKKLKNLELKLGIVGSLEAKRREPVRLIDALTQLMVPERMWITSLKTDAKSVVLKGLAFDNKTVADFMTRIEKSPLFSGVDLKTLQMKQIKGAARIKSFEVFCWKKKENKNAVDTKKGKPAKK